MRRWTWLLCFLASDAVADPIYDFDGNDRSIDVHRPSSSTDTVRNDNNNNNDGSNDNDSSDAQPSKPKGPSQRDLQKERQRYELIRQGEHAARRGKYADAIRHLERANAPRVLAAVQHKQGLLWFKQKHYLAGRWKVEDAIRNDPDEPAYAATLALMHEKWCRANRPLFPPHLSGSDDEMGFHDSAVARCEAKVAEAQRGEWQCAWLANECLGF